MIPLLAADGSWRLLVQDRTYWPGAEDQRVPFIIAQRSQGFAAIPHAALRIDGGNMLSNREYAFVGSDAVTHTTEGLRELATDPGHLTEIVRFYEARTGLKVVEADTPAPGDARHVSLEQMWQDIAPAMFESLFSRKICVLGQDDPSTPELVEKQPAFHIDMAVTPIGEDLFLVGDPSIARHILQGFTAEEREHWNGTLAKQAGLGVRQGVSEDLIGKLLSANSHPAQQANFDNVARELQERGYRVLRVPYLEGVRYSLSLPYFTYNNCLQERYQDAGGREICKVYLPTYGVEPLDAAARKVYENLGYQVVPLKMAAISLLEGAIRCSAYPVRRTDVPAAR